MVTLTCWKEKGRRARKRWRDRTKKDKNEWVAHVRMGTSSSEVVSSERGISSTSSSEEEEEKEGDAERGRKVGDGEGLKREILHRRLWKRDAREGLLGGAVTGGVCCVSVISIGWTGKGGGGEGGGASACCCVSVCWDKASFWGKDWLAAPVATEEIPGLDWLGSVLELAASVCWEEEAVVCVILGAGRGIKPHLRRRRTALRTNRGLRLRGRVEALSCLRSCSIPLRESETDWKTEKKWIVETKTYKNP